MPRINLLPWRAERAQEATSANFAVWLRWARSWRRARRHAASSTDHERPDRPRRTSKNQLLKTEIASLDKQITEILGLENQKQRLLARMEIIQKLQRSRPEVVHLFDQLVRTLPDGVYLTSVKQSDKRLELKGMAQSSTRVSAFMRNIDDSEWMDKPELEVVETKKDAALGSEFTLFANQVGVQLARRGGGAAMTFLEDLRSLDKRDIGRWPAAVPLGSHRHHLRRGGAGRGLLLRLAEPAARAVARATGRTGAAADLRAEADARPPTSKRTRSSSGTWSAPSAPCFASLPGKTEVPSLLVDISQTGLAAGLQEKLFQPAGEVRREFYAELPIKIRLTGSYHQLGNFVSGIAALPRIVTLHDIEIKPESKDSASTSCVLDVTAKTYRYLEEDEDKGDAASGPKGAKAQPARKT